MWSSPGFVDAHTHVLAVTAGEEDHTHGISVHDYHQQLKSRGIIPTDEHHDYSSHDLESDFSRVLEELRSKGILEIHEAGIWNADYWTALQKMRDRGPLPIRVRIFMTSGTADLKSMKRTGDESLELLGVKFYSDGWLGSRTASVSAPYLDEPKSVGVAFLSKDEMCRRFEPYANAGWQLATHAIGDAAIEEVLDAYEAVYGDDCEDAAPRIEHVTLLREDLVDRFAELGVIACVQPSFATSDWENVKAGVGEEKMKFAYNWRELIDAGVKVIVGSDFPIETYEPLIGLRRLVTGAHETRGREVAHTLPLDAAIRIMTDEQSGIIELSSNPAEVDPSEWEAIMVLSSYPAI